MRHKVKVPSKPVSVSYGGDEPIEYEVTRGQVVVESQHLERFLRAVPGAELVGDMPEQASAPSLSGAVQPES